MIGAVAKWGNGLCFGRGRVLEGADIWVPRSITEVIVDAGHELKHPRFRAAPMRVAVLGSGPRSGTVRL